MSHNPAESHDILQKLCAGQPLAVLAIFLGRHPPLAEFTASPSCALFRVQISSIYLVTRFQNVMEFHFSP